METAIEGEQVLICRADIFGNWRIRQGPASPMSPRRQLEIDIVRNASLDSVPSDLPLDAVHLWQRPLQVTGGDLEACHSNCSSTEERERAQRYRVERPRSDYILTRGTLRSLLAKYLRRPTQEISFRYTDYGKPFLVDGGDLQVQRLPQRRHRGYGICESARDRSRCREGSQAERRRADSRSDSSPHMSAAISVNVPGNELHEAFFRCWTRKEAYIKAKGEGLSLPLHQFDVSIESEPATGIAGDQARRHRGRTMAIDQHTRSTRIRCRARCR